MFLVDSLEFILHRAIVGADFQLLIKIIKRIKIKRPKLY